MVKTETKRLYYLFVNKLGADTPPKCDEKWIATEGVDWAEVHKLLFICVKETKLQCFQYNMLHRILPTNTFLFRIGCKNTPKCRFCNIQNETIEHFFMNAPTLSIYGSH